MKRPIGRGPAFVSTFVVLATVMPILAWWWIVFAPVHEAKLMTIGETVPCLVAASDLCSLAQAICRGDHFFGVRHYDPSGLWVAFGIIGIVLALNFRRRGGLSRKLGIEDRVDATLRLD